MTHSPGSSLAGILLVAGTTIGGGMLALPVLTGLAGFAPSLLVYFFCWLFMMSTGLLFLEIALALPEGANIISMSEKTLGLSGKICAWFLYLFLFYCLMVAYTVGCGNFLIQFLPGQLPAAYGPLLSTFLLAPLIYAGTRVVAKLNNVLMVILCACFVGFIAIGLPHIDPALLAQHNWSYTYMALPIAFTSFAYQGTIPTLVTFLQRDVAKIRKAILFGSLLSLITYVVWQAVIQGIVPVEGAGGLREALAHGESAVVPLKRFTLTSAVSWLGSGFAFAALVTSFFGVSLGLMDFLADGFNIKKTPSGKALISLMLFIPPLVISYTHPTLFLTALEYAGGYGCALLLGFLPIAMVWSLRYHLKVPSVYRVPGGKPFLLFLLVIVTIALLSQIKVTIEGFAA